MRVFLPLANRKPLATCTQGAQWAAIQSLKRGAMHSHTERPPSRGCWGFHDSFTTHWRAALDARGGCVLGSGAVWRYFLLCCVHVLKRSLSAEVHRFAPHTGGSHGCCELTSHLSKCSQRSLWQSAAPAKGITSANAISRSQASPVVLNTPHFTCREQSIASLMCFEITSLGLAHTRDNTIS